MDKGYLSSIESGRRRPSVEVTRKIADVLDVPVAVLTGQIPAIAALRKAQNIGDREFANDIGVTTLRLRRLEAGSELPTPQLVAVIANRLGVDPTVIRPADEATS
jgi:transcriptional regulator with XRE-family HTH domain